VTDLRNESVPRDKSVPHDKSAGYCSQEGQIAQDYAGRIWTQDYSPKPRIDGVEIVELPVFSDEGGDFCEIVRFLPTGALSQFPAYQSAQLSYSFMEPGAIKAWHLHRRQDDLWFVPPNTRLLVGLLDVREGSSSYQVTMRLALGAGKARLLLIPRGVAHGVANVGRLPASLIYLTNQAFDPHDPDEHRLPYDLLGADFWTMRAG
jgi:dTDP-4-dehydrorhamnose 3,5-epimerase